MVKRKISVDLEAREARILVEVAEYHLKAMGPMRRLVRFSAPVDIRNRYTFVSEESKVLKQFAEAAYEELSTSGPAPVIFTPRALVAFWGRLLASLNTPRSRRRLSKDQVAQREALASKLEEAVRDVWRKNRDLIEQELRTRRPSEADWMRERLQP